MFYTRNALKFVKKGVRHNLNITNITASLYYNLNTLLMFFNVKNSLKFMKKEFVGALEPIQILLTG